MAHFKEEFQVSAHAFFHALPLSCSKADVILLLRKKTEVAGAQNGLAPALGQYTQEILKELAYDEKAIEELRVDGTI